MREINKKPFNLLLEMAYGQAATGIVVTCLVCDGIKPLLV